MGIIANACCSDSMADPKYSNLQLSVQLTRKNSIVNSRDTLRKYFKDLPIRIEFPAAAKNEPVDDMDVVFKA